VIDCGCYFTCVFAGTELAVEGLFEEEAEKGVRVGIEEWGLRVCQGGHYGEGGSQEKLYDVRT